MPGVFSDTRRGTTNQLRQIDRWILYAVCPTIRAAADPLVVDLGFGASPSASSELFNRLRKYVRPDCEVAGIDRDLNSVAQAQSAAQSGLTFVHGSFEIPTADSRKPIAIRAANVLQHYDESDVQRAWATMSARLAPDGYLIDATCDERGSRSAWVSVRAGMDIPETLTLSFHVGSLKMPSEIALQLPKALIHRNVPGEKIHDFLKEFDHAWLSHATSKSLDARERFVTTIQTLVSQGFPIQDSQARWRLGEVTIPWNVVSSTSSLG